MADFASKSQIHRNSLINLVRVIGLVMAFHILGCLNTFGQDIPGLPKRVQRIYEEARQDYESLEIASALEKVNLVLKKAPEFAEGWLLKAYCYKDLNQPDQYVYSLQQAVRLNAHQFHELNFLIAESLFNQGQYELSETYLETFRSHPDWSLDQFYVEQSTWLEQCLTFAVNSIDEASESDNPIRIQHPLMAESSYFPSITTDGQVLVYTVESFHAESGRFQEDLFSGHYSDGQLTDVYPLSFSISAGYNEGTQTLRQDGRFMIFTGCNYPDTRGGCDLYYSMRSTDSWQAPTNLDYPVNTRYWESTPSLSPDSRMLIFSSNRPGGIGGMDLWYSLQDENGQWLEPRNMGPAVNTGGNELAPFFHLDGQTLFFSTDSLIGLGGLDIYITKRLDSNSWSKPVNLGYPINTFADEFGITVPGSANFAIFASDRDSSRRKMLYSSDLKSTLRPDQMRVIQGLVADSISGLPLKANITIRALTGEILQRVDSDPADGNFLISLPTERSFLMTTDRPDYFYTAIELRVDGADNIEDPIVVAVKMKPIQHGDGIILDHVYFDTDSDQLKDESNAELALLQQLLMANPKLSLVIEGYTDSVGASDYNIQLSQRRAESIKNALIQRGIKTNRLVASGLGEQNPRGDNSTEEGRALNRRTEVRIRDFD